MMNEKIFKAIENEFGGEYDVKENSVTKNNGVVKTGVLISEKGSNVGMAIYLDGVETEEDAIKIVREGINNGIENARKLKQELDLKELFGRENLLEKVYPVLVNRGRNTNEDVIKSKFLDLDVIYKIDIDIGDGLGCVTLTKQTMQFSDVGIATMHRQAIENIKGKGIIMDMEQKIRSMIEGNDDSEPKAGKFMNVVTSNGLRFGAAVLLDDDIVNELSDIYGGKFFALPSSIHELITVPVRDDREDLESDKKDLLEMVRHINESEISETDFLSDNVYYYHDGEFEVVS